MAYSTDAHTHGRKEGRTDRNSILDINIKEMRKPDTMSPMKNPKRPFYNFYMKFMMYLDYSTWKFPIPRLREGGKGRGKLSHCIDKPKFLPSIILSVCSSSVVHLSMTWGVLGTNPSQADIFFSFFKGFFCYKKLWYPIGNRDLNRCFYLKPCFLNKWNNHARCSFGIINGIIIWVWLKQPIHIASYKCASLSEIIF